MNTALYDVERYRETIEPTFLSYFLTYTSRGITLRSGLLYQLEVDNCARMTTRGYIQRFVKTHANLCIRTAISLSIFYYFIFLLTT